MVLRGVLAGVLLSALAGVSPAWAHEKWSNGEVVPKWIKQACCGPSDVHHLTPEQVHLHEGGSWSVDGYNKVIPPRTELYSPDGEYWIFYKTFDDGTQSSIYCWFVPMNGM